jgi:hypothetical protein
MTDLLIAFFTVLILVLLTMAIALGFAAKLGDRYLHDDDGDDQ